MTNTNAISTFIRSSYDAAVNQNQQACLSRKQNKQNKLPAHSARVRVVELAEQTTNRNEKISQIVKNVKNVNVKTSGCDHNDFLSLPGVKTEWVEWFHTQVVCGFILPPITLIRKKKQVNNIWNIFSVGSWQHNECSIFLSNVFCILFVNGPQFMSVTSIIYCIFYICNLTLFCIF